MILRAHDKYKNLCAEQRTVGGGHLWGLLLQWLSVGGTRASDPPFAFAVSRFRAAVFIGMKPPWNG